MHGKSFQKRFRSKNAPPPPPPRQNPTRKGWQRVCTLVPREWELRLLQAKRISTYRLAIEVLYLHWYGNGKPVTVSSAVAKAAKLSDRSKSRALTELERLDLIETDRSRRRSPRVTLRHVPAK
jgi:hypothetical protein